MFGDSNALVPFRSRFVVSYMWSIEKTLRLFSELHASACHCPHRYFFHESIATLSRSFVFRLGCATSTASSTNFSSFKTIVLPRLVGVLIHQRFTTSTPPALWNGCFVPLGSLEPITRLTLLPLFVYSIYSCSPSRSVWGARRAGYRA